MMSKYWECVLAGLLHDIGKLGQRAYPKSPMGLSTQSQNMREYICVFREKGGFWTHLHTMYTNEFFNQVESSLPSTLDKNSLIQLAIYHHRASTSEQKLIEEADHLASAFERENSHSYQQQTTDYKEFRESRLYPIARNVDFTGVAKSSSPETESLYHTIELWDAQSDVLFPKSIDNKVLSEPFLSLWEHLIQRTKAIQIKEPWSYFTQLMSELETTTWCVPSATNAPIPDVSLFDHSRAVSAIAGCLAKSDHETNPFLFVAGDFSGIQSFLYDLKYVEQSEEGENSRKGYAKRLRGRSFAVRMFTEQVTLNILKSLDLAMSHRVLTAGGKMYLLLPNSAEVKDKLDESRSKLETWSLKKSHGRLRFNLAWDELSKAEIKNFGSTLSSVNQKLDKIARKPFIGSMSKDNKWDPESFLLPQIKSNETESLGDPFRDVDLKWGEKLTKSNVQAYLNLEESEAKVFPLASLSLDSNEAKDSQLRCQLESSLKNDPVPTVRMRIARNVPKNVAGEIVTFGELADKAEGYKAIGFIKADVDNLGFIFKKGLPNQSMSHVATLSRSIEGFFGAYVEELCKTEFKNIYLVYSGGDDVAAVGPWNEAINFIIKLRSKFSAYVCQNPNWGLSAGVYIGNANTPILTAMHSAENALNESKSVQNKNCITLFGSTCSWVNAEEAVKRGEWLVNQVQNDVISVSQVRRLLHYAEMYDNYSKTKNTAYLRFCYLLAYDLKRNWSEKTVEQKEAKHWAQNLENPQNNKELNTLSFATKFAVYALRGKKEVKEEVENA